MKKHALFALTLVVAAGFAVSCGQKNSNLGPKLYEGKVFTFTLPRGWRAVPDEQQENSITVKKSDYQSFYIGATDQNKQTLDQYIGYLAKKPEFANATLEKEKIGEITYSKIKKSPDEPGAIYFYVNKNIMLMITLPDAKASEELSILSSLKLR